MIKCNRCGQQIHFDDSMVSANGKKIPLQGVEGDEKHDCPNNPYKQQFKQVAQNVEREITTNVGQSGSSFKKNDALGRIAEHDTEIADLRAQLREVQRVQANQGKAIAEMSFQKGTDLQTTDVIDDEVVQED